MEGQEGKTLSGTLPPANWGRQAKSSGSGKASATKAYAGREVPDLAFGEDADELGIQIPVLHLESENLQGRSGGRAFL